MDPARKEKILICATAQFVENGFEGTSLNALLRDLEMNKSSAYYYFFNKADIYFTAMDRAIALITPSLPPSPNNEVEWRKELKKLQTVSRITIQISRTTYCLLLAANVDARTWFPFHEGEKRNTC
jgi:AcrR family transcriptional regulator